jgi:hypothetical protein
MSHGEVLCSTPDPDGDLVAVFEDDGRVAYAYLLRANTIVADVWVYNRVDAPAVPEWSNPNHAPFLNPREFVREAASISPASSEIDVSFEWRGPREEGLVHELLRTRAPVCRLVPGRGLVIRSPAAQVRAVRSTSAKSSGCRLAAWRRTISS